MEAYLAANQAFATYLKNVNQELAEIYMLLGGAVKNTQNEREASRKLQADVMREMSDLESTAATATDMENMTGMITDGSTTTSIPSGSISAITGTIRGVRYTRTTTTRLILCIPHTLRRRPGCT